MAAMTMLETIIWRRGAKNLPVIERENRRSLDYGPGYYPFEPVLFRTRDGGVCAGRYFGPKRGFWSLQGQQFTVKEVQWWAPLPKGESTCGMKLKL
jgi:hypothetical protein